MVFGILPPCAKCLALVNCRCNSSPLRCSHKNHGLHACNAMIYLISSTNITKSYTSLACDLVVRINSSELWLPPLRVMQATTWQLITFAGSKPSGRYYHVGAWSDAADGLYIHGGWTASVGLRRSGGSETRGSEAANRMSSGSSVGRLAVGMEREHGVVTRSFL